MKVIMPILVFGSLISAYFFKDRPLPLFLSGFSAGNMAMLWLLSTVGRRAAAKAGEKLEKTIRDYATIKKI
jgi:hypothetical protein